MYLGSDKFYEWLRTIGIPLPKDCVKLVITMKHGDPVKLEVVTNIKDKDGKFLIEDDDLVRETRNYKLVEDDEK